MMRIESDVVGNLQIVGDLTVFEVDALREGLLEAIGRRELSGWSLDLSGLCSWDSAGVQTLLSLKRSVHSLRLYSSPKEFRAYLEKIGLAEHLL